MTVTIMKKTKSLKTGMGISKNMGGNIPGGNFLGGNLPGGSFLDTKININIQHQYPNQVKIFVFTS